MVTETLTISELRFTAAADRDRRAGLLGFVRCVVNRSIVLDGLTLRRSAGGRVYLGFPARRDRHGAEHYYVRPLDAVARAAIERQILAALQAQAVLP